MVDMGGLVSGTTSPMFGSDVHESVSRAVPQDHCWFVFSTADEPIRGLSFKTKAEVHIRPSHGRRFFAPISCPKASGTIGVERPFVKPITPEVKALNLKCFMFAKAARHLLKLVVQYPLGFCCS